MGEMKPQHLKEIVVHDLLVGLGKNSMVLEVMMQLLSTKIQTTRVSL
jgi:hypothetical protein